VASIIVDQSLLNKTIQNRKRMQTLRYLQAEYVELLRSDYKKSRMFMKLTGLGKKIDVSIINK
jgi:hypothetical protein